MFKLYIISDIRVEIWRRCEDYPNYEISNKNGLRHFNTKKEFSGRINHGYRMVSLGKYKEGSYHILVAKTFPEFCGEWFEGCNVHHKNFDRLDNRPENLIVLSANEHQKLHYKTSPDTFKKPTKKRSASISKALKGKPQPWNRKPIIQLSLDGSVIKRWDSAREIQDTLGYDPSNISSCCKGRLKTAYGSIWKFVSN